MVLYRNQWSVNFSLHLSELHIGSSIKYKNTLFGIVLNVTYLGVSLNYTECLCIAFESKSRLNPRINSETL